LLSPHSFTLWYCNSLSIALPLSRNTKGLPSSTISRFKWGSILLILRWIYGSLHDWKTIQSFLSILSLLHRSTLIVSYEDYKGSIFIYTFHFSPNPALLLRKAISLDIYSHATYKLITQNTVSSGDTLSN
jgi:hypothetical protein